jgi:thiamine pyrophosphate-dependent acetolactate synthase large subunit-like protein
MADHELKWKIPKKREFLGGDLVAQSLAQLGVDVSFGLHGGHLDAFLIGCALAGIRLIDTRHEAPAVQAAEAYAKLSGKVGCCFVTANSGYVSSSTTATFSSSTARATSNPMR